ncbi:MAG: zinc metallopeptidase [bacterium]
MFMFIDPLYLVMILPALALAIYAQVKVKRTVKRYSAVGSMSGMTGASAARRILDGFGLNDVPVEQAGGWLSDHYDPGKRVLRLSPEIHSTASVAAVGIAAHEAGHALQHAQGYAPLKLRNAIVPTASIGSWLAFPMIIVGFIFQLQSLALAGLVLFGALVLFQIITLPVELDASARAKKLISELGIVYAGEEREGVAKVLNAAAMTYVAATVTAIVQLLYFALSLGILGDD